MAEHKQRLVYAEGLEKRAKEILTYIARNSKRLGLPHINSFRYGMDGLNVLRDRLITVSAGTFKEDGPVRLLVRCHEDGEDGKVFVAWQGKPPAVFGLEKYDENIQGKLTDFVESQRLFIHSNAQKAELASIEYSDRKINENGSVFTVTDSPGETITVPANGFFRGGVLHQSITLTAIEIIP